MEIKPKTIVQTLAIMFGTIILGIGANQLLEKMPLNQTYSILLVVIGITVFILKDIIDKSLKAKLPDWTVRVFVNPIIYALAFSAILISSQPYITTFINGHTLMAFIIGAGLISYAPSIVDAVMNID